MSDSPATPRPTYRIRRSSRAGDLPRGYRYTLTVLDEHTRQSLVHCDIAGIAGMRELTIVTTAEKPWKLAPNRSVLPTSWALTDEAGCDAMQFNAELARKLVNPLTRTALVLEDPRGDTLRLADMKSSLGDRVMGVSRGDWSLLRGSEVVASFAPLPSQRERGRGLRAWVRDLLTPSDRGLMSSGDAHVIGPAATLAMVVLFDMLTDRSA
jgi:hypothetical protein